MRVLVELATVLLGFSAVGGLVMKAIKATRRRSLGHAEYQERLRRENEELDDERRRLGL